MAKSKQESSRDLEREASLVEIDGEFCVPTTENETRHLVGWGPFEVERSPWYVIKKVLLFVPAMFLFILAIQLMKSGAAAVGPSIKGQFPFANGFSTLGTGWLGAYFVLSGSPVAATAISLFGAGTLSKLQAFTMLSGSRLGASFIVLLTGFLYAMKHKDRPRGDSHRHRDPGHGHDRDHLHPRDVDRLRHHPGGLARRVATCTPRASSTRSSARLWGPFVDLAERNLPGWALFVVGIGVILVPST